MRSTFRRLSAALVSAALVAAIVGGPSLSANLSLFTGPGGSNPTAEMPPGIGTFNQLINNINSGVGGLLNAQTASVGTTAVTTEEVLQTYTLPANTLAVAGQAVRITCPFSTGATANNKTVRLYFGGSSVSTGAYAGNAQQGYLQLIVMRTAAATQGVFASGVAGTGSVSPVAVTYTAGTDALTAGVVIKCTGQNGTAAANDIIARAMITELVK